MLAKIIILVLFFGVTVGVGLFCRRHATNIGEWAEFSVDGIHRNGDCISDLFNPNSL